MNIKLPSPDICPSASVPENKLDAAVKFIDQVAKRGGRSYAVEKDGVKIVFYSGTFTVETKS